MKDLFLADAHLHDPSDENYRCLLDFLAAEEGEIRTLYLLGDLFDFWVGDPRGVYPPYQPLLAALQRLHAGGTRIVYVEGNHDFLLGPRFSAPLRATILPSGGIVDCDGLRVRIDHGDLLNPDDRAYRCWRALIRSRLARLAYALAPARLTWTVAAALSRRSKRRHGRRRTWDPRQLIRTHAARHFAEGCDVVVTGHFHTPFLERDGAHTVVALGDWIHQYSYAVCENGQFSLHTLAVDKKSCGTKPSAA